MRLLLQVGTTINPVPEVLLAFAVTLILSPAVLAFLRHLQVMDTPNSRSLHTTVTPRGAGLAVALGCAAGLLAGPSSTGRYPLIIAGTTIGLLGLIDDVRHIPALHRLAVQFCLSAAVAVLALHGVSLSLFALGIAAVWTVAYVNAFNFMDGINGISAAQAGVAGLFWGAIGLHRHIPVLAVGALVMAAAVVAFLPFNFPRAKMFLGDVGSYFLGAWIAVLVIVGIRHHVEWEVMVAPVALYLADTGSTIVRRTLHGERFYEAHREHAYQRLVTSGWSHPQVTGLVSAVIALSCLLASLTLVVHSVVMRVVADAAIVAITAAYLRLPAILSATRSPEA